MELSDSLMGGLKSSLEFSRFLSKQLALCSAQETILKETYSNLGETK
jgi:hypothetical protein